jgi:hypothetical protein
MSPTPLASRAPLGRGVCLLPPVLAPLALRAPRARAFVRSCPCGLASAIARPACRGRLTGLPSPRQFTASPAHVALKTYVANVCSSVSDVSEVCCKCSLWMLQRNIRNIRMLQRNIRMCTCCNGYTRMFQEFVKNVYLFQMYVESVLFVYCK